MKKLLIIPILLIAFFCKAQDSKDIIGKPIKIGNLYVAQNDFPITMNWLDAKTACDSIFGGWRLPTKDELNTMYQNKKKIGGFALNYYWSSSEYQNGYVWKKSFGYGEWEYDNKSARYSVRAVRSL